MSSKPALPKAPPPAIPKETKEGDAGHPAAAAASEEIEVKTDPLHQQNEEKEETTTTTTTGPATEEKTSEEISSSSSVPHHTEAAAAASGGDSSSAAAAGGAAAKSEQRKSSRSKSQEGGGVFGAENEGVKDFETNCLECLPLLLHRTEQAFHAAKEVVVFFKKRIEAENSYARHLLNVYKETATLSMVKKITKETTLSEKEIGPSLKKGWLAIEQQTQFECQGRLEFAAKLQEEVLKPLEAWIKETEPLRKKLNADGTKRAKEIHETRNLVNRLKEALDRADGLAVAPPPQKVSLKEKMASMVSKKVPSSRDQIEAEYHAAAAAAGEARIRYQAEVPAILRELERLERGRMEIISKCLQNFLDLQVVSFMGFQENWPSVHQTVSEASPAQDIASFISSLQHEVSEGVEVTDDEGDN